MNLEEKDNLYLYETPGDEGPEDSSPRNFAVYDEEDSQEENDEQEEMPAKKIIPFLLVVRIMFSPVEGWKMLRRSGIKPETLQANAFYPLLALLALSKFADYIYAVDVNLTQVITEAVIAFVAFFFGYFCIIKMMELLLPAEMTKKFDCDYGKSYFIVALTTITLFSVLKDLLPMLWPILFFLPIWTMYLMFKGVRFFKFEEHREWKFYLYAVAGVIGMPLIIEWVLNALMPL